MAKFAALKYRDFRLLWLGLLISNIGSQMQFAAINWHIFTLTHSAAALGLIGLTRFIPITIFALVGGIIADTHNRKKILLTTQIALTALSLFLALKTAAHADSALLIYVVSTLSAVALAFDTPPRQAIVPSLVDKKHLESAMGLGVINWQTSAMLGPALAGFVISFFGIETVYFINTISFIAVIWALLAMQTSGEIAGEIPRVSLRAILEGFTYVRSKTIIWSTMLLDFFSTFFASATALLPIFAEQILKVGPVGFGFLYAAPAAGAVVAGFLVAHQGNLKNQGKILLTSVSIYGLATILFGVSRVFWLSFLALFLVGVGDSVSTIIRNTIRQLTTPDYIRGRMTAVNMIFFLGGPQLGEFEAGILASAVGAPLSVVVGGVSTIAIVALVAARIPVLRKYSHFQADAKIAV